MNLMTLLYFVLSLFGVEVGGSTFVDRVSIDGADALHSKATVEAGVARFECLRSASGQCHYTLYRRDCAPIPRAMGHRDAGCRIDPVERFALADGDSRRIPGLLDFRLCVSAEPAAPARDCGMPEPIAAR